MTLRSQNIKARQEEGVMATGTITLSGQIRREYYVARRVAGIQDVKACVSYCRVAIGLSSHRPKAGVLR
jgi:hypothetical protein